MKILQTDKRLNKAINKYGCYFRSLLAIAEDMSKALLSHSQILEAYKLLIEQDAMEENCYMLDPEAAVNVGFQLLGQRKLCYQIGIQEKGGDPIFWAWVRDRSYNATCIQGITAAGNKHFVQGNEEGNEVWNPYPGAELVKIEKTVFYKVVSK